MPKEPARSTKSTQLVSGEVVPTPDAAEGVLASAKRKAIGPKILTCVVCSKTFQRDANNEKKAKVCTPFEFKHVIRYEKQPDGVVKKITCACCRCLYKKTMSKNRSMDGKLIPTVRIGEFLSITQSLYPEMLLAFRVGLNAMLRVTELASLTPKDFELVAKPLPRLNILSLKKTVQMYYPVDIDHTLAAEIRNYLGDRIDGLIFDFPVRTLQHKFKQVVKKMGLGDLSIHSLRHTGITNVAKTVKTMDELNYLRKQARHESIETTKLYMGFEDDQRVEMMQRIKHY